jgi:phage recombination protein Bet
MTDSRLARREQNESIDQRSPRGLTLDMVTEMTGYEPAQIALVSKTVAIGAPLQELAVFLHACKTLHLDPLLRQAYWIRRRSGDEMKGALQVGIDGFRAIAERSGAYAGSEPPRFLGQIEWSYKNSVVIVPERAQVVVWKIVQGHKAAFTGEANWIEFCPAEKDAFMYSKMPRHMLAKDAEAQALRKAFPALLGSVQISPLAEGESPESEARLQVVERNDRAKLVADAAKYDDIFNESRHAERLSGAATELTTPEPPLAMVTSRKSPLWTDFTAVRAQAVAEGLEVPDLDLPQTEESLRTSTADLSEAVAAARAEFDH